MLLPPQPRRCATIARAVLGRPRRADRHRRAGRRPGPLRPGAAPDDRCAPTAIRDDWEDALLTAAIDGELPFLGICRGLQVLNVARGGTLHAAPARRGRRRPVQRRRTACSPTNEVEVDGGSRARRRCVGAGTARRAELPPPGHRRGSATGSIVTARIRRRHRAGRRARGRAVRRRRAVASGGGRRRRRAPVRGPGRRRRASTARRGHDRMSSTTLINPPTRPSIGEVEHTSLEQVDEAVARAVVAQAAWAALAPADRAARAASIRRRRRRRDRGARRSSRCATPAIRSARRAGRPGTCATCSTTTRARPSG